MATSLPPGHVRLLSNFDVVEGALKAVSRIIVEECVNIIRDVAVTTMKTRKPLGEWYRVPKGVVLSPYAVTRYGSGGALYYRASRLGHWPAVRTGTLISSFQTVVFPIQDGMEARVGTDVPYAEILEFELDRSFLLRAAKGPALPKMRKVLRTTWRQELGRLGTAYSQSARPQVPAGGGPGP
jgi:hypothetical protein